MVITDILNNVTAIFEQMVETSRGVVDWLTTSVNTPIGEYAPLQIFMGVGLLGYLAYIITKWIIPI